MKYLIAAALGVGLAGCIPVVVPIPVVLEDSAAPVGGPLQLLPASAPVDVAFDAQLNAARSSNGAATLVSNSGLDAVALAHTRDMVARGYVSHRSPEGVGPDARVQAAGIATCGTAEVVASGQTSLAAAFADWMASPGHRRAILDPTIGNYGVGQSGTVYALVLVRPCPVAG